MPSSRWLVGICAVLTVTALAHQAPTNMQYTVEAIYGPSASSDRQPADMQWSPDGTKLTYIQRGAKEESLHSFDPITGKSTLLISGEKLAVLTPSINHLKDERQRENRVRFGVADYQWAPDSKSLLFDALGKLWIFNLAESKARQLTDSNEPSSDPKFSPDGKFVSYIRAHNLYVRPVKGGDEIALTKGTDENLLNGEVDWLYSEELGVRSNYFWSPDANQILFLQMNEASVPQYPIVNWMPTHPEVDLERYPKAGDPNPTVKLMLLTGLDSPAHQIDLGVKGEFYIPRFGWARPGLAWAVVLNRRQNQEDLYFIDTHTGKSHRILRETDPNYIELHDPMECSGRRNLTFLEHSSKFLWLSWRDGFTHVYLYSFNEDKPLMSSARLEQQLERGNYEVSNVIGVDEALGVLYIEANKGDDRQEQIFSVPLTGGEAMPVTQRPGVHTVLMSADAKYFVDTYSSLREPAKVEVCAVGGPCDELWVSHRWDGYETITPRFVDFRARDGQLLHGVILLPPAGAKTEINGKVPLILNPYGGPCGQTVRDAARTIDPFDQVLANNGFAVLKVDNRGTGNRGRKFAMATFRRLYEPELSDNFAALDQALDKFPQLDSTRVGWWGWSYGASLTIYAMTHSERFKAGISVSPVTDWHDYDSAYTERYMGLPTEERDRYHKSNLVNSAAKLKGRLLLVHGTSDDNVHMQNSIQLADELINSGLAFDLLLYPGKTHGIAGARARMHLFNRMLWHWEQYLAK